MKFDHTLGESFYHPRLQPLVQELMRQRHRPRERGRACAVVLRRTTFPPVEGEHPALDLKRATAASTTPPPTSPPWRTGSRPGTPTRSSTSPTPASNSTSSSSSPSFRRWHPEAKIKLAHVWFGSILGEDGKPFKTRSGETVKLADLLDEAEERAFKLVSEKSPDLPEAERREIARVVGIGAVKYADLLPNRQSDYVFSWDKLLALERQHRPLSAIRLRPHPQHLPQRQRGTGRPACPLRIPSRITIAAPLHLAAPEELALARHLLNFGLVLEAVAEDYRPNFLCNYLYDLAGRFTGFYENCPVLKSEAEQRASRLVLCDLTARVLKQGLDVLGIETLEQM